MKKRSKPSLALPRRPSHIPFQTSKASIVDVFERVVTKGIVIEIKERSGGSETPGDASMRLHVSNGGVDVLKVESCVSWRYVVEDKEKG